MKFGLAGYRTEKKMPSGFYAYYVPYYGQFMSICSANLSHCCWRNLYDLLAHRSLDAVLAKIDCVCETQEISLRNIKF